MVTPLTSGTRTVRLWTPSVACRRRVPPRLSDREPQSFGSVSREVHTWSDVAN